MLDAGTKLGRYEIRSKIGEGGMGEVYLAEDTELRRRVALKILPAEVAANQDRMRRFKQEAQAAAALNHPNIAHIYEIGEASGVQLCRRKRNRRLLLYESGRSAAIPRKAAIKNLTKRAERGDFWLFLVKTEPVFDPLRGDPQFEALVKKFDPSK